MERTFKAAQVINNWREKPIRVQVVEDPFADEEAQIVVMGDLTTLDAMLIIVNNHKCQSIEESEKARKIKQALFKSGRKGKIILDQADHKWLVEVSKRICPPVWNDNAEMVLQIIEEGYSKENSKMKE